MPKKSMAGFIRKPWLPYVVPFALFMLLTEPARYFPALVPYLYVTKTVLVGGTLWLWRHVYADDFATVLTPGEFVVAILCGLLVLVLWIVPEGLFYQLDSGTGFNPYVMAESKGLAIGLIAIRLIGASIVVPVMEELFWRSFLMRYLVDVDFRSVALGTFTWLSFLGVAILFGLEHHRIVAGILAGLLYGALLLRQKKLRGVVIAHGVTNFGLGVYVVVTGNWLFW
ncbi:CAAX prenyl protease-related protein [Desulfocapsa sulfexigens DSM 10523]|uniref:CAAX prenyl protease-related protein n=1 Tax=Desulfocapsa sulfexigens (strain DSM 10523 / SB164P1) TaxID=1167006 RepID=M1NAL1_DESSD|nr:CAAX prenyl protease-related protein [Desulfocapsa sulfexigens]AGF76879.1 CAAX prenyl protease-related protein [Desulfocapsa sulfexigens DSM 10523]